MRVLLEFFKEKRTLMAEATTVGPWPSPRPVVPTTARGSYHGRGGPHSLTVAAGHLGFVWEFGQRAPWATRGDSDGPWWPDLRWFIRKGANFCTFSSLYSLSYSKRCLFRYFQPYIYRVKSDTIMRMKSKRVTAVPTLIKLEKIWTYTLVLSAFYPEDYLWYTANKSYGKWSIHNSLIYPVPQNTYPNPFPNKYSS